MEGTIHLDTEQCGTFDERVRDFIRQRTPKLYILTPCFSGLCYISYVICLNKTLQLFTEYGFAIQVEFCNSDSLITRARNNLIARALSDPLMTHALFIDNDISWSPVDILKLVLSDKHLVGGVYPLKRYNWNKLSTSGSMETWINKKNNSFLRESVSDELAIRGNLVNYNVNFLEQNTTIKTNLAAVRHIATGFMMMRREMLVQMQNAHPELKYEDDVNFLKSDENTFCYALFDCRVVEGHYLSEDWLFCKRWSDMGGSVFMDVTINLNHTGSEEFVGSYITTII